MVDYLIIAGMSVYKTSWPPNLNLILICKQMTMYTYMGRSNYLRHFGAYCYFE